MNLFAILALSLFVSLPVTASYSPVEEANKKTVEEFIDLTFNKHKPEEAIKKFVGEKFVTHSPLVKEGKDALVQFVKELAKNAPQSKTIIKRTVLDNNFVVAHGHITMNKKDLGSLIVFIFRLENGKIVESWDIQQPIPAKIPGKHGLF